jgi:hypothetical protein
VAARIHSGALFACRSTGPSALYGIPAIGNLEVLVQSRELFLMFDAFGAEPPSNAASGGQ